MGAEPAEPDLDSTEIHRLLANERRQLVLQLLRKADGSLSPQELADKIAEAETGESPPPENIQQSAYVSLHQTHLPKLDELHVVKYDQDARSVTLQERADGVFTEVVPKFGLSDSELYLAASALGLLLLVGSEIGMPVLAEVGSAALGAFVLSIIVAFAAYRVYTQGSSIIHRLWEWR